MSGPDRVVALALVAASATACGRFGFDTGDSGDDIVVGPGQVAVRTGGRDPGVTSATGIVVWSNRADGSLDDASASDENGEAVLDVEAGGSVSAAYPGSPTRLRTVFAVEAGDELVFGADVRVCDSTPRGTVTVSWAAVQGAVRYDLGTGCNQIVVAAPDTTVAWAVTAEVPDPIDLVVYAIDGTGERLASATRLGASTTDGATITFGPADWFTGPRVPVGFTGIPSEFTDGDLIALFRTPSDPLAAGAEGVFTVPVIGGALQFDALVPMGLDHVYATAAVFDAAPRTFSFARRFDAPYPDGLVTALDDDPPRRLDAVAYDAAAHRITWTEAAPGGVDAQVVYYLHRDDAGLPILQWTGWAPPGGDALSIPALPDGVSVDTAAPASGVGVVSIDYLDAQSWTALRQRPEWMTPFINDGDEPYASSTVYTPLGPVP